MAVNFGLLPQEFYDNILVPALIYIGARLAGKGAKALANKSTPKEN